MKTVVAMLVPALALACGSGARPMPDFGGPADATDATNTSSGQKPPTCSIVGPHADQVLSESAPGTTDAEVQVADPEGIGVSKVVFALRNASGTLVLHQVTAIPADGQIVADLDTMPVPTGKWTFLCQVETSDGRAGISGMEVFVDNEPPIVAIHAGPGNFIGNLEIIFSVTDGNGVGTDTVEILVNGKAQQGPAAPVQEGVWNTVIVPVDKLQIGMNHVELWATDLAGNKPKTPSADFDANNVAPPRFTWGILATFELTTPHENPWIPDLIAGIVFDGEQLIAAGGPQADLRLFRYHPPTEMMVEVLNLRDTVDDPEVLDPVRYSSHVEVVDLNGDGLDDIVTVRWKPGQGSSLHGLVQTTNPPGFKLAWSGAGDILSPVNDVAFGDLDGDTLIDVVAVFDRTDDTVGTYLSKAGGGLPAKVPSLYDGVTRPHLVGIGDFTGDGRGDILVGQVNKSIATVYPVDGDTGLPTAGFNSTLGIPGSEKGPPTALIVGNWGPMSHDSLAVYAAASTNEVYWARTFGGEGTGEISVTGGLPSGLASKVFAAGDIDLDGEDDLALLSAGSNMVNVYWGRHETDACEPPFETGPVQLLTDSNPRSLAIVDLVQGPGPSHPDVAFLCSPWGILGGPTYLMIIPYDDVHPGHTRRFLGPVMLRLDFQPADAVTGTYSKNDGQTAGQRDLAILRKGDSQQCGVDMRFSDDDFRLPIVDTGVEFDCGMSSAVGLESADLDLNGFDDLLVPSRKATPLSDPGATLGRLLLAGGPGLDSAVLKDFVDPATGESVNSGFFAGNSPYLVAAADLDMDPSRPGALDLAVVGRFDSSGDYMMQPFIGNGDGTFAMHDNPPYPVPAEWSPSAITTAALSGGGTRDVIIANYGTGDITVMMSKGQGFFMGEASQSINFAVGVAPLEVSTATIEDPADDRPDILILVKKGVSLMYSVEESIPVLFEPVGGGTGATQPLKEVDTMPGHFPPPGYSPQFTSMVLSDVNGDGLIDVVLAAKQQSRLAIRMNLGNRNFEGPYYFGTGVYPASLVVDDLDADGCQDILTADEGGHSISILRNMLCDQ